MDPWICRHSSTSCPRRPRGEVWSSGTRATLQSPRWRQNCSSWTRSRPRLMERLLEEMAHKVSKLNKFLVNLEIWFVYALSAWDLLSVTASPHKFRHLHLLSPDYRLSYGRLNAHQSRKPADISGGAHYRHALLVLSPRCATQTHLRAKAGWMRFWFSVT